MGGFGSGRRREVNRGTVDSYYWLDIGALAQRRSLGSGWSGVLEWPAHGGRPTARVHLQVQPDHIVLAHRVGREARDLQDTIAISDIACHFGFGRPYFVCPGLDLNHPCGRSVTRLYFVDRRFRCRHCHRLTYASRSETAADRAYRRANAIRRRLGGPIGIANPFPDKPPHMSRHSFERLRQKAVIAEQHIYEELADELGLAATGPQTGGPGATPQPTGRSPAASLVLEHLRRIAFADIREFFDEKGRVNRAPVQASRQA
jgi:hypothetical protein